MAVCGVCCLEVSDCVGNDEMVKSVFENFNGLVTWGHNCIGQWLRLYCC